MKIISPFKDYYDSVGKLGYNNIPIYIRKSSDTIFSRRSINWLTLFTPDKVNKPRYSQKDWCWVSSYDYSPYQRAGIGTFSEKMILWFCGRGYPFIRRTTYKLGISQKITYHYKVINTYEEIFGEDIIPSWKREEFTFPEVDDTQKDFLIDNKIVIALAHMGPLGDHNRILTLNPCLKDFEFFRVKDAFSVYQEIEMFLGGVLSNNPEVTTIPDKYKIGQHGFDKMSFRKYPEKPGKIDK